jgi:hypothetical protein
MAKDKLLENKILGIITTTGEDVTVKQLAVYTRETEENVNIAVDKLVKDNKLAWGDPKNK